MERAEQIEMTAFEKQGLNISAPACACATVEQSAEGKNDLAVVISAEDQIRREAETRAIAPEAYRLSTMSEFAINFQYRRGKDCMSSADLVRYISETRAMHLQSVDLLGDRGVDACPETVDERSCTALTEQTQQNVKPAKKDVRGLPARVGGRIAAAMPTWFDTAEPDTSKNSRRFPRSACAAMLAVAMSLLLIVARSVMVRLAESDVSRLKTKLSSVTVEAEELKSDFEVGCDLLEIRQIASEEYGMVAEDYVKMDYISLRSEDSVEAYEEERGESVGLSALLSAIGWK